MPQDEKEVAPPSKCLDSSASVAPAKQLDLCVLIQTSVVLCRSPERANGKTKNKIHTLIHI